MPKLSIPEQFRPGIEKLQKLNDAEIKKLHDAMIKASSNIAPPIVTSGLVPLISEVDIPDSKMLAETIVELYRVKTARDLTIDEFIESICDALRITNLEKDKLTKNLRELLDIDQIELSAKAEDLQTEDERTFCRAKILTDLRPVFGAEISEGPKSMVIVHKLKLGYHDEASNSHRDFHVSLDSDDLKALRKIIDRAQQKAESLKTSICNFKYMGKS